VPTDLTAMYECFKTRLADVTEQIGHHCASRRVRRRGQQRTAYENARLAQPCWSRSLNASMSPTSDVWLRMNCLPRQRSRRRLISDHLVTKRLYTLGDFTFW